MEQRIHLIPRHIVFFFVFACIGIGVWFMNAYAAFFNSFFLSVLVVMTASPLGFWLQNHGVPRWLALSLSVIAALGATLFIGAVLALAAVRLLNILPQFLDALQRAELEAIPLLRSYGLTLNQLHLLISPEAIVNTTRTILRLLLDSVSLFGVVLLIVLFMVIEAFIVPIKFRNQSEIGESAADIALGFTMNIRQYVGITSLLGLVGGGVIALVLALIGIPFPLLWGVLYFVLNFVPMVGFWLALLPPLLLAFVSGSFSSMVLVVAAYMITSTLINQAIKPAVMRGGLDLSPFWSIMSLIVWSTILGPLGLIVGVPLTIALKELVFAPDERGRWLAVLMGAGLPVHEAVSDLTEPPVQEIDGPR